MQQSVAVLIRFIQLLFLVFLPVVQTVLLQDLQDFLFVKLIDLRFKINKGVAALGVELIRLAK